MNEDRSNEPLDKAAETAARIVRAAGQTEKIAHSIQAVHAAAGAVRAGGAASGATVGTALGGPLGTLVGALPVSYTHLDVYKRQVYRRGELSCLRIGTHVERLYKKKVYYQYLI